MFKIFDLELEEKKICKRYRRDIFKKIGQLPFSEKKNVLRTADHKFLNILEKIVLDMDRPRRINYTTHYDRFYLSSRLSCVNGAINEMRKIKKQQQIQKRKANIKLVWKSNNSMKKI
jgi:hypothetical protein